ncbi:phenoloxidase 2 [Drosophila elegans]|uniref:phenoloxidase 2 n=1 Tax=Drosophila elegans TaxID=30023 RepID=UPI0007E6ADD0|nr:phenoloxidase 2 [Drosophila elegans]
MLRLTYACLCFLAIGNGIISFENPWRLSPLRWNPGSSSVRMELNQWQGRQRFLLDLLLQVHKPLLHEELIAMGSQHNEDPRQYKEGSWRYLKDFLERVHQNRVPQPFGIFSQLDEEMPKNLLGVYRFLVFAKDWTSFQQNACYARMHFHPLLFVNALQLAVADREDTKDFRMPAMYEVLPQLYFEKEVILAAQEVAWHQLTPIRMVTPKRRWKDILLGFLKPRASLPEEETMSEDPLVIDNKRELAYLSLDMELNSHWNYLINRLIISSEEGKERLNDHIIIDGDRLVSFRGPLDEVIYRNQLALGPHLQNYKLYIYNLKQFVAALTMEDWATGQRSMDLIDPPLMTTGGVSYQGTSLNIEAVRRIIELATEDLKDKINEVLNDNVKNYLNSLAIAGQMIANNYIHICRQLNLAVNGNEINKPSMLGLATANLRDPIYRSLLFRLNEILMSYENENLSENGEERVPPKIIDIKISRLMTYEESVNTDLINLIDQQLLQSQRNNLQFLRRHLVAKQHRLNHEPFSISLNITAPNDMTLQLRMYLILPNQSGIRLHLDTLKCSLKKGINQFERLFPAAVFEPTLSELYEADYPSTERTNSKRFPPHLLLPRGTREGLKLQLLVELTTWTGLEQEFDGVFVPVLAETLKDVIIFHHQA